MKRALIVTLALLLLVSFFPAAGEQEEEILVCEGYEYCILEDGTAEIMRYQEPVEFLEIPDKLDGLVVTRIGDGAFTGCENLKGIAIPDSVTSVGYNPFDLCTSLSQVTVHPDHPALAIIDGVLFSKEDKRLVWYPMTKEDTAYEIPRGTLMIGGGAFSGCENLRSVTLPDSVISIGLFAFVMCNHLSGITLPDSVTSIDSYAFSWCENLSSITIPDSVASIGADVFYGCKNLKEVIVTPDSYAQKYCEEHGLPFVYQENAD